MSSEQENKVYENPDNDKKIHESIPLSNDDRAIKMQDPDRAMKMPDPDRAMKMPDPDRAMKMPDPYREQKGMPMRYYPGPEQPPFGNGRPPYPRLNHLGQPGRPIYSEDTDLTDAMVFLNRIKEEYADSMSVYDSFLETMRDFKFGKIDAEEACKAVRILFKNKSYLIRMFDDYLPQHMRYIDRQQMDYPGPDRGQFYGNQPPYQGSHGLHGPMHPHPPGNSHMHLHGRTQTPPPPPPPFSSILQRTPSHITPSISNQKSDASKHKMANDFIQLVKRKYSSKPIVYKQFVDLLKNSKGSFDKLVGQVSALLSDTPDLISKFERDFRPSPGHSEGPGRRSEDPLKIIKETLAVKGVEEDFLKIMNFYNQNYVSAEEIVNILEPVIDNEDQMRNIKEFLKYEGSKGTINASQLSEYERIGSYRIFPNRLKISTTSSLSREILNVECISMSTQVSEDDPYIFREKNSSEELLVRVSDERSESDLNLDRLKYLICKLEELYSELSTTEVDMDCIEMSSALVKETLKSVYNGKASEVLEAILSTPQKALPVIISRLHKVYKENAQLQRLQKDVWRRLVKAHYYRAYDVTGVAFKNEEKNLMMLKSIYSCSRTPFILHFDDKENQEFIKKLVMIYLYNMHSSRTKKIPPEDQEIFFTEILEFLSGPSFQKIVDFDYYALYLYICTLYSRFQEIKKISFEPMKVNEIAIDIGYQERDTCENRYEKLLTDSLALMEKKIDPEEYENDVRYLTDLRGYKLYNLKKLMSRIVKQMLVIMERKAYGEEEIPTEFDGKYAIEKNDGVITMCYTENVLPETV